MICYNAKRAAGGAFAVMLAVTLTQPLFAEELNTEIPSAGATVVIEKYLENAGSESDLSAFLPKEAPKAEQTKAENKIEDKQSKYFSDIAIAKVSGGKEDYVNVRKKPNVKSKRVGKIYNNCGARILETTKNGWYKIVSGNCTGYIKSEFFVTGTKAETSAMDDGYVFATIKDSGIHVRESATTESGIVTNVYKNERHVIKKFTKDGKWVKVKIEAGVSGWVSAEFIKVSINMDTAITNAEEKEQLRREKEQRERERQQQLQAQQQEQEQQQQQSSNNNSDSNNTNNNTNTNTNDTTTSKPNNTQSYGDSSSSGGASAVVAYAKQFLGNPYVYGGSSLTNGTDCSGFTMSVYAHFGYSLNRSSYTQVYNGTSVSMSALKPGDLLFYKYGGSTISHVAIYIGGGQIIHASTESTGIIISGMGSPCAARRIIN